MALTKALIFNLDEKVKIPVPVMFNPPDYKLQKTNNYAQLKIPGKGTSVHQFVQGDSSTLTLDLFFDTTDSGADVRTHTNQIVKLGEIMPGLGRPPRLLFTWGMLAFDCILVNVTHQYEYFNAYGLALRARMTITLVGYDRLEQIFNDASVDAAARIKVLVVKAGDTLQSIAAKEYGDPKKWRKIAEVNKIDNPLTVQTGKKLNIPRL